MKFILSLFLLTLSLVSCGKEDGVDENIGEVGVEPLPPAGKDSSMLIRVGLAVFTATLYDNAAVGAFRAMLPMTITMNELNGNEKYYDLPRSLPLSASNPGTVRNGDIMLYGSGTLVLFYKTFSTPYRYTRLASVDDPAQLESALGKGDVIVRFESKDK